jgi:AraC-like DNA-binding protein
VTQRLQKTANELREKPGPHRGLLDVAHAAESFTLRRYFPSARLKPFVEHFWTLHWDLRGKPPYTSEVLPHPSVNLAFIRERGWITGVTTGKYTYTLEGEGAVLGIQFRPGAFRPFLGRSVATITDKTLPATDVFPTATDDYRLRLIGRATDAEIVADGEALLLAQLPEADPGIDLINAIVTRVRDDRTLTNVAHIARDYRMPQRTLQHLFQTHVGVGLKWIIRRYRLMEAAERAEAGDGRSWTAIALELGYADQAHFTNDFTRIVGRPPTDHMRYVSRPIA